MALLALYMIKKDEGERLETFLDKRIFARMASETIQPDEADTEGFEKYISRYISCIPAERAAVETLKV